MLPGVSSEPGLADGVYEAFIVDVEEMVDGGMRLDVVMTVGEHKGFVVSVVTDNSGRDEFDLLGVPATLTVRNGEPSVRLDP